jgi:hypothetical protein
MKPVSSREGTRAQSKGGRVRADGILDWTLVEGKVGLGQNWVTIHSFPTVPTISRGLK